MVTGFIWWIWLHSNQKVSILFHDVLSTISQVHTLCQSCHCCSSQESQIGRICNQLFLPLVCIEPYSNTKASHFEWHFHTVLALFQHVLWFYQFVPSALGYYWPFLDGTNSNVNRLLIFWGGLSGVLHWSTCQIGKILLVIIICETKPHSVVLLSRNLLHINTYIHIYAYIY